MGGVRKEQEREIQMSGESACPHCDGENVYKNRLVGSAGVFGPMLLPGPRCPSAKAGLRVHDGAGAFHNPLMRYTHVIYQTLPMFAFFGVMLGAGGASNGIWRPLVGGAIAGAVIGVWAFGLLRRNLVEGKEHWTMRKVPGGVWFFVGLGLLGGVAGITIMEHDEGLAVDLGLALCVLFFTGFSLIGIGIRREEKRHNMEVWLGPGGLEFHPPE